MPAQRLKISGTDRPIDAIVHAPSASFEVRPRWANAGDGALRCVAMTTTLELTASIEALDAGAADHRREDFLRLIRAPLNVELGNELTFGGHAIHANWKDLFDNQGRRSGAVVTLSVQHDEEIGDEHRN